jgi:PAS domain S-box-containing protein
MAGREPKVPTLTQIVVDSSLDGLAVMDRDGRYTLWNRAMERFAGKTAEEVLGRVALEVFPFLRDLGLDVAFARALAGEAVTTDGVEHVEPDGTRRVFDRLYMPLRSDDGEIDAVLAIVHDATARYATLDALKKSEAILRMAAEAGEVGLWSWDPTADVVVWEDGLCRIFGLAQDDAPKTRDAYLALVHPDDRGAAVARVARGRAAGEWSDEYRIVRGDGAMRWVMSKARGLHVDGRELVLGALFDVTERKEREERQRAAQRLEAVGQLTAGIAHNFNNMLMSLLPNLELARRRAPADLQPLLRDAEEAAQRAADVVRELMTFAGSRRLQSRHATPLGELASRTALFSRTTFDPRIAIDVGVEHDALALVDATQIEQALLNVLINARDAVSGPLIPAPRIRVDVTVVREGAPELEGRAGEWARVRVADNGIGMTGETLERVYEPFFTTKEAGKGTGLGLATTHGILRDHGGFIACASELGGGTTFSLYLPVAPSEIARPPEENGVQVVQEGAEQHANATILVVDDEAPVRKIVSLLLEDAGFAVKTAASGDEALRVVAASRDGEHIGLVLLDVSMPGMPGPVLRRRLRELAPDLPVVFLTGAAYEGGESDRVLQKPISRQRLVSAVDAALAGR